MLFEYAYYTEIKSLELRQVESTMKFIWVIKLFIFKTCKFHKFCEHFNGGLFIYEKELPRKKIDFDLRLIWSDYYLVYLMGSKFDMSVACTGFEYLVRRYTSQIGYYDAQYFE